MEVISRVADDVLEAIRMDNNLELHWDDLTGEGIQVSDLYEVHRRERLKQMQKEKGQADLGL